MPALKDNVLRAMVEAFLVTAEKVAKEHNVPESEAQAHASAAGLAFASLLAAQRGLPVLDFVRQAKQSHEHYAKAFRKG